MSETPKRKARIFYARVDEFWRKEEKYAYLDEKQHRGDVEWQEIQPDAKHNWLTEGMHDEFESFMPIGNKETREEANSASAIFLEYSRGCETGRDSWVYGFEGTSLLASVRRFIAAYNEQVHKWHSEKRRVEDLGSFLSATDTSIKWTRNLKESLLGNQAIEFKESVIRDAMYRPFAKQSLYFDSSLVYLPGFFRASFLHLAPKTITG